MCIPPYIKYLFLSIIVGALIIISVFSGNLFYILPIIVFAVIQSRITCPRCHEPILKDKNDWYIFTMRTTCRHCGYDTMICDEDTK